MSKACDQYEVYISGYLDGELDPAERSQLEEHVRACSCCRRELESLQRLVIGTSESFKIHNPPEVVWDNFLDGVYNRMERKTGWWLLTGGSVALALYALMLFFYEPWTSALLKVLITIPLVGLILVFLSVLRQRLRVARTDRYSREVHR